MNMIYWQSILLREDNYIEILESFLQDVTYERVITILNWPIFELIKKKNNLLSLKISICIIILKEYDIYDGQRINGSRRSERYN